MNAALAPAGCVAPSRCRPRLLVIDTFAERRARIYTDDIATAGSE